MKLAQKLIVVISLLLCLVHPVAFSPFYAKSEALMSLLCGTAVFVWAISGQ
jgi:hypothetical protein